MAAIMMINHRAKLMENFYSYNCVNGWAKTNATAKCFKKQNRVNLILNMYLEKFLAYDQNLV